MFQLIASNGSILQLTDFGLSRVGLINSTEDLSGPAARGSMSMEDLGKSSEDSLAQSEQRVRRKQRSAVGTPDYLAPEILLGTSHGMIYTVLF
jgi:serine/threonine protein kinase